ncbi:MAG TPA: hypothetical protein ENI90_06445 [Methylothermaceae bacterium]|nr:hypothetical protein [Methylothermaceae bacterium]
MFPYLWVHGPAGAGKTTLLATFRNRHRLPTLWYRTYGDDQEPGQLILRLRQLADRPFHDPGEVLPILADHCFSTESSLQLFLVELQQRLPPTRLLVFDNWERIPDNSHVQQMMADLAPVISPGLTLVFLSRLPPPPAFARHRIDSNMALLTPEDLRLNAEESRQVIAHVKENTRCRAIAESVLQCRGWFTGLIAQLKFGRHAATVLDDYFRWEIFRHLSHIEQDLLLQAAQLPEIEPAALEKLTGHPSAFRLLKQLHHQGCFIEAAGPDTYRLHPQFRQFLQHQAQASMDLVDRSGKQRQAAHLPGPRGWHEATPEYYREAGDLKRMTGLIQHHAPVLLRDSEARTLRLLLDRLPPPIRGSEPWMQYWYGMTWLLEDFGMARTALARSYRHFVAFQDVRGRVTAATALVRLHLLHLQDLHGLETWTQRLKTAIYRLAGADSELEGEALVTLLQALVLLDPRPEVLAPWYRRLDALKTLNPHLAGEIYCVRLLQSYWRGRFSEVEVNLDLLNQHLAHYPSVDLKGVAYAFGAKLAWHSRGDTSGTEQFVFDGLRHNQAHGLVALNAPLYSHCVSAQLSQGNINGAVRNLKHFRSMIGPGNQVDNFIYHHLSCLTALLQGHAEAAKVHLKETEHWAERCHMRFHQALAVLGSAYVYINLGQKPQVTASLRRLETMARRLNSDLLLFEHGLLAATLHLDEGVDLVRPPLQRALAFGRRHDYRVVFLHQPERLARLFLLAIKLRIEAEYARAWIHRHHLSPPPEATCDPAWPWPVKIYTLGRFGIEVNGRPLEHLGAKPFTLLKILLARGGRNVSIDDIAGELWPDAEGDRAYQSFKITLRRLRHNLENPATLILKNNRLTLNPDHVWCDLWAFTRAPNTVSSPEDAMRMETALYLYHGPFLKDETFLNVAHLRHRLRQRFKTLALTLGKHYQATGRTEKIDALYTHILSLDDDLEALRRHLQKSSRYEQNSQDG